MASWLVKTEPGEYSWADLVRDRRTNWDGVTNPQAQLNLRTMAKGDTVVVYHSQTDKAAVGLAKVVKAGYPDPTDANAYFSWWSIRNPYVAASDRAFIASLIELMQTNAEFAREAETIGNGMTFSGQTTVNDMLAEDLPTTSPRLAVPFIVIEGADDIITPTSVAKKYFDMVQAPVKKWIEIPDAGHFAIVTHAAQFRDVLLHSVRPLAL